MSRLAGKTAIVTGAGRGIGRAYALALAEEGANVVVNDLGGSIGGLGGNKEPADEVVAEAQRLGAKAFASYEDVADYGAAERTVQRAVETFGTVDILITNAAIERRGELWEISEADWDAVLGTHAKGTFNYVRHAGPLMARQKSGTIINITSGAAWGGSPSIGAYATAKGAIISFMLSLSTGMKAHNVNVNCLSPGLTGTRLAEDYFAHLRESAGMTTAQIQAQIGTPQPPEALAPIAIFLCCPEGHEHTGKIFEVAGDRISVMTSLDRDRMAFFKPGGWSKEDVFGSFPRSL